MCMFVPLLEQSDNKSKPCLTIQPTLQQSGRKPIDRKQVDRIRLTGHASASDLC